MRKLRTIIAIGLGVSALALAAGTTTPAAAAQQPVIICTQHGQPNPWCASVYDIHTGATIRNGIAGVALPLYWVNLGELCYGSVCMVYGYWQTGLPGSSFHVLAANGTASSPDRCTHLVLKDDLHRFGTVTGWIVGPNQESYFASRACTDQWATAPPQTVWGTVNGIDKDWHPNVDRLYPPTGYLIRFVIPLAPNLKAKAGR